MTEQPQYYDGQIINGWKYVAATNSWERPPADPVSPSWAFSEPVGRQSKAWYTKPWAIVLMVLGFFFIVVPIIAAFAGATATTVNTAQPAQPAPVQPAPVQPAPVQPAPNYNPEPQTSEKDAYLLLLESAWDKQGVSGQRAICDGWALGFDFQETVLDQFEASISGTPLTRSDVRNFFNGKC